MRKRVKKMNPNTKSFLSMVSPKAALNKTIFSHRVLMSPSPGIDVVGGLDKDSITFDDKISNQLPVKRN